MNVVMFVALILFVGIVVSACVSIIRSVRLRGEESEEFLSKVTAVQPDTSCKDEYDKERKRIFDLCRDGGEGVTEAQRQKHWDPDRIEDDQSGDPANAWQRELPGNLKTALKTALMKRTIAQFPAMATLPREIQQKAQMYQRGLVGQPQWRSILRLRDWLEEETMEIKHEAECLQEKWGSEGLIFKEAAIYHQHMAKKAMEDAQDQMRRRAVPQTAGSG